MIPQWKPVRASRLGRGLTLAAVLALLASLALWWQSRRQLDSMRRELQAVTTANLFLRKTVGDMTVAIAAKDREIDRLGQSPCRQRPALGPVVLEPRIQQSR